MPDSRSLCQQDDLVGSGDYGLQDLSTEILKDNRPGWTLEEVYMAIVLDRDSTEVPPSRSGLALAMVDFARLGFTLLGLHLLETEDADGPKTPHSGARAIPLPEWELARCVGSHSALSLPGELTEIALSNGSAWQHNRERLML